MQACIVWVIMAGCLLCVIVVGSLLRARDRIANMRMPVPMMGFR